MIDNKVDEYSQESKVCKVSVILGEPNYPIKMTIFCLTGLTIHIVLGRPEFKGYILGAMLYGILWIGYKYSLSKKRVIKIEEYPPTQDYYADSYDKPKRGMSLNKR